MRQGLPKDPKVGPHDQPQRVCPAVVALRARCGRPSDRWLDAGRARPDLDQSRPALLLAHAYVRYLGDLSAGQLLRGIVARGAALAGTTAVAFYDFGDALSIHNLTHAFRAGLRRCRPTRG
jgi:hypothetical protein